MSEVRRFRPYYFDPIKLTGHEATMRQNSEGAYVLASDYDALQARVRFLEEMGAECVNDWKRIEEQQATIERLQVRIEAAEVISRLYTEDKATIERLRGALEKYGQHSPECNRLGVLKGDCYCGFHHALDNALAPPSGEGE